MVMEIRWGLERQWYGSAFFFPSEPLNKLTIETTVSLEKEVGEHADVFIEYVGDYPEHGPSPIVLNSGGAYVSPRRSNSIFTSPWVSTRWLPNTFLAWGIPSGLMACSNQVHYGKDRRAVLCRSQRTLIIKHTCPEPSTPWGERYD